MCEAMALDRLNTQFWVKDYLITPISQTVEEGNGNCCVQYKVHISRPTLEQEEVEKPLEQVLFFDERAASVLVLINATDQDSVFLH